MKFLIRLKRNKRNLLILAGVVILVEFAFGIALDRPEYTYFFTKFDSGYWDEDPELFWINQRDYRENVSAVQKSWDTPLVYCFGGSITRGDFADTSFCKEMEKCLPKPWKVVNFATSGYSSHQSLVLMKRAIRIKKPALVIVSHGWNDSDNSPRADYEMAFRNKILSTHILYWVSKSNIVQALRKVIRTVSGKDPYSDGKAGKWVKRVDTRHYKTNIELMGTVAKENQFPLVLMSQGVQTEDSRNNLQPYFDINAGLADADEKVHYLDTGEFLMKIYMEKFNRLPITESDPIRKYLFLDLCHLNNYGHELVGKSLCEFIENENLLSHN